MTYLKRLPIILILVLLVTHIKAQKLDSTIILQSDSFSLILNTLFQKGDKKQIALKEMEIANYFRIKHLYDLSVEHLFGAEKIFKETNDMYNLMNVYIEFGKVYYNYNYGENTTALHYYLKAYAIADSLGNETKSYSLLGNIGSIYSQENRHNEGLKHLLLAVEKIKSLGGNNDLGIFYGNIANVYVQKNKYDSAYIYYQKSNKFCFDIGDTTSLARNYVNIANLSIRNKKHQKALNYLNQALNLFIEQNNYFGQAISYKLMAKALMFEKEYEKARKYAFKSLVLGKKIKSSNRIKSAYKILWKINNKEGNYKEALNYLNIYKTLSDSLEKKKQDENLLQLMSTFKTQKNLHEIRLLKAENSLKQIEIEKSKSWQIFLGILTIVLLLGTVLFVWLFMKNKKAYLEVLRKNIELEKQEIKEEQLFEQKQNTEHKGDMLIIEKWREKIVKTAFFTNTNCTIEICAKEIDTNRTYLSRAINNYYGTNFSSVINELRIKTAKKILRKEDVRKFTIESIAQEVGFSNKVSFSASFKKITGLTPAFYRDNANTFE